MKTISGCPPDDGRGKVQANPDADLTVRALGGTVAAVARLVGMRTAREYLELASHCESEAAKAQDKFSRYQLLSFAESYRTLRRAQQRWIVHQRPLKRFDMLRSG